MYDTNASLAAPTQITANPLSAKTIPFGLLARRLVKLCRRDKGVPEKNFSPPGPHFSKRIISCLQVHVERRSKYPTLNYYNEEEDSAHKLEPIQANMPAQAGSPTPYTRQWFCSNLFADIVYSR